MGKFEAVKQRCNFRKQGGRGGQRHDATMKDRAIFFLREFTSTTFLVGARSGCFVRFLPLLTIRPAKVNKSKFFQGFVRHQLALTFWFLSTFLMTYIGQNFTRKRLFFANFCNFLIGHKYFEYCIFTMDTYYNILKLKLQSFSVTLKNF